MTSDWRLNIGVPPEVIDKVPMTLFITDVARNYLTGENRTKREVNGLIRTVAEMHVVSLLEIYKQTGAMPSMGFTLQPCPSPFLPYGIAAIHGVVYTTDNIVIAREDEILEDYLGGKMGEKDLPAMGVDLLMTRASIRHIRMN